MKFGLYIIRILTNGCNRSARDQLILSDRKNSSARRHAGCGKLLAGAPLGPIKTSG
jgi:hypothetical protein